MTRHLFKLVWRRKRTNALIILEIFFSFLVVFVVATLGTFFWNNYRQPLGYSYQDVWRVTVFSGKTEGRDGGGEAAKAEMAEKLRVFDRLIREIEALEPVESASVAMVSPFDQGGWTSDMGINGRQVAFEANAVTVGFADALGMQVVAGRWFQPSDEALAWDPIVIDRDLARAVYGDEDPVGKAFGEPAPGERQRRVIGVVSDFRKSGELSAQTNFLFHLLRLSEPSWFQPQYLMVRVEPGTAAAFEEELSALMQGVAPEWSFQIKPLAQVREAQMRNVLTPLAAGGTVAFFLLLMVGLGLIGVLWQNLLQRTREIGLRRAAGATRSAVHRQVVLEQLILTTLGVLLGVVLVVQIPLLDLIGFVSGGVYAAGLLLAAVSIYLLSMVCALYPSTLASRVQPAEALRYE